MKEQVSFRETTSSSHVKRSPSRWLHNKSRLLQWCFCNKKNITRPLVHMNFIFSCSTRYLTSDRTHSRDSKIKLTSTRWHVISPTSLSAKAWACERLALAHKRARLRETLSWRLFTRLLPAGSHCPSPLTCVRLRAGDASPVHQQLASTRAITGGVTDRESRTSHHGIGKRRV